MIKTLLVLLLLLLFLIIFRRDYSSKEDFINEAIYKLTDTESISSDNLEKAEKILTKQKVLESAVQEKDIKELTKLLKIEFNDASLHQLLQKKGFLKDVDFLNIDFSRIDSSEMQDYEWSGVDLAEIELLKKKIYYKNKFVGNNKKNNIDFSSIDFTGMDFSGMQSYEWSEEDLAEIDLLKKKLYFKGTRVNNKININKLKLINKNILPSENVIEDEKATSDIWELKNYKIEANKIKKKVLEDRLIKAKIESRDKNDYDYLKEKLERINNYDPYKENAIIHNHPHSHDVDRPHAHKHTHTNDHIHPHTIHSICPLAPIEYNVNEYQTHNLEVTKHPTHWDGVYNFTRKNTFPANYIIL